MDFPAPKTTKYQSLDLQKHCRREVAGQTPEFLPFLFTPTSVAKAAAQIGMDEIFRPLPLLQLSSRPSIMEYKKVTKSMERGEEQEISKEVMKVDQSIQSIEYMSSSPIFMPFYIVEYTNSSIFIGEEKQRMKLAVPGWKAGELALSDINYHWGPSSLARRHTNKRKKGPQIWTKGEFVQENKIRVFFIPRVPIVSGIRSKVDMTYKIRKAVQDFASKVAKWLINIPILRKNKAWCDRIYKIFDAVHGFSHRTAMNAIRAHNAEDRDRNHVEIAHITMILQDRIQKLLRKVLSTQVPTEQQKHEYKLKPSIISPEKQAGFGQLIDWSDPLMIAPSGCDGKVRADSNMQ